MSIPSTTFADLRASFGDDIFTPAQARAAGVSGFRLGAVVEEGRIRRVGRGRYTAAAPQGSRELHLERASGLLVERPAAVLAGVSAAAAWGLACPDEWGDWSNLALTIAAPRKVRIPRGGTAFRLGGRTWGHRGGLPLTDLVPTALDAAWQLPLPNALIVLDSIALRLVGSVDRRSRASSRDRVRGMLLSAMAAEPHRPGTRRIRTAVSLADPDADSPPESYLRGHVVAAGLPEPIVNAAVVGASGRAYYADLYWPAARLVVEVDGAVKYADREVLLAEKRREDDLRATGVGFIRVEAKDVFAHAPLLVADIWAALRLRAAA